MQETVERKLASVQRIAEIKPIDGADAIEAARVNGWWVVVKRGEFKVGDLVAYYEIDSWVPYELAPFLCKGKEPREFNGVKGERLRTVKLRGQVSQGLILPLPPITDMLQLHELMDLTELLGVQKWEKPIPAQLQGQMRGNFPSFIRKTDQERIQNIPHVLDDLDSIYEVSIKLDGSSMTVYWDQSGQAGVCSRNVDLKLDQDGNTFVDTAKKLFGLADPVAENLPFHGFSIQGELMGPGIQGNRENLKEHEFYVFDIWDIEKQEYVIPEIVSTFCSDFGLKHVPVLHVASLRDLGITDMESMLKFADGASINNSVREGLVFKRIDGKFSFKVISNKFLIGEKE